MSRRALAAEVGDDAVVGALATGPEDDGGNAGSGEDGALAQPIPPVTCASWPSARRAAATIGASAATSNGSRTSVMCSVASTSPSRAVSSASTISIVSPGSVRRSSWRRHRDPWAARPRTTISCQVKPLILHRVDQFPHEAVDMFTRKTTTPGISPASTSSSMRANIIMNSCSVASFSFLFGGCPETDVVVLPERCARDFGEPGSDLSRRTPSRWTGHFRDRGRAGVDPSGARRSSPGCSSRHAGAPYNTVVVRGGAPRQTTARSTSTTRSGTRSPTSSPRGRCEPAVFDLDQHPGSPGNVVVTPRSASCSALP